jgi:hypothetical protein
MLVDTSCSLDMATPTGRKVPLPAWATGLHMLHGEQLGKAALVEHILVRRDELAKHEHRAHAEKFEQVLWKDAHRALSACTFESPLMSLKNGGGLRRGDLLALFDHVDRCAHFPFFNSNASKHRSTLLELLARLKEQYVAKLGSLPQSLLALFEHRHAVVHKSRTLGWHS